MIKKPKASRLTILEHRARIRITKDEPPTSIEPFVLAKHPRDGWIEMAWKTVADLPHHFEKWTFAPMETDDGN